MKSRFIELPYIVTSQQLKSSSI